MLVGNEDSECVELLVDVGANFDIEVDEWGLLLWWLVIVVEKLAKDRPKS